MTESTDESVGTIEKTMMGAIGQSISIAHHEIATGRPDMARVSKYLRLGSLLLSGLEDFREDVAGTETAPKYPASAAPGTEVELPMSEITGHLRDAWVIRKGALINFSKNSAWSYKIPKQEFVKVVDTMKNFAAQGEASWEDLAKDSGIKVPSHAYRVYVLLSRAGLLRQQKNNTFRINEQEAMRLDPEEIWQHLPKE